MKRWTDRPQEGSKMQHPIRWIAFEIFKLCLVFAVFVWIHGRVIDTQYETYAQSNMIVLGQENQEIRLLDLEAKRSTTGQALSKATERLKEVDQALARSQQNFSSDRDQLVRLIDSKTGELRNLLETGLGKAEGYAEQNSLIVKKEVDKLASTIERHPSEMKRNMIYPIVQLRGNGTVGSGVAISSKAFTEASDSEDADAEGEEKSLTYILTAYHVVLEIIGSPTGDLVDDIRFMDPETDRLSEEACVGKLLAFDEDADIALVSIKLDKPWPHLAAVANVIEMSRLDIFDRVYAVGCPLGNKPLPTTGEISSQEKLVGGQNFWMVNAPTFFGNSGGGVFQSDTGKLIGISSMIYTYGKSQPMVVPHMGLFVPLGTVKSWLLAEGYGYVMNLEQDPKQMVAKQVHRVGEGEAVSVSMPENDMSLDQPVGSSGR